MERKLKILFAALIISLLITVSAYPARIFYEDYPDPNALITPSPNSICIADVNVNLTIVDDPCDRLVWNDGIGDIIPGPTSGGTVRSFGRLLETDPSVAYMIYQIGAPEGETICFSHVIVTAHALKDTARQVKLTCSVDGNDWKYETMTNEGSYATEVLTIDLADDPN